MSNKFDRLSSPPPQLFFNKKEKDFVKQVNQELTDRVIGQSIVYYPISLEHTNFHPLYGEAINKSFLSPVQVYALIEWEDGPAEATSYGVDKIQKITIHFHKRRLVEDQNLFVRLGDFVAYGENYYEIVELTEPKRTFGQIDNKIEIVAKCIKARKSLFETE